MVVHKRKKVVRQRGSRTYGWGHRRAHRSGHIGGRGMAGTGKRADSKKPSIWKYEYFGKRKFKPPRKRKIKALNLYELEKIIEKSNESNKKGIIEVNLKKLGFDKLLGKGNIKYKVKVIVSAATEKAIKKVKEQGGEVIIE